MHQNIIFISRWKWQRLLQVGQIRISLFLPITVFVVSLTWHPFEVKVFILVGIHLFKVSNRNARTVGEVIEVVLLSLLLLWTDFIHCSGVFIVDFEQVHAGWADVNRIFTKVVLRSNVHWTYITCWEDAFVYAFLYRNKLTSI